MALITSISNLLIPATILVVLFYGFLRKVPVYDTFIEGAKDGILTVFQILPTLIGLMVAVAVLRASGALDLLVSLLRPLVSRLGFPAELLPLSLMRLFSSSGATGLALDLFGTYGPDSFIGRLASVMLCCTETVFYTLSLYYMRVGVKKTRYTLPCALLANIAGIAASLVLVVILFGK